MVKTTELIHQKLLSYRTASTGEVFVKTQDGAELLVECGKCGSSKKWFIPPGPKEGVTLICSSCYTNSVLIFSK